MQALSSQHQRPKSYLLKTKLKKLDRKNSHKEEAATAPKPKLAQKDINKFRNGN